MEGLLPMVYKSIKKNKTRRQYEHLSSGLAQSYSISDFYVTDHHGGIMNYSSSSSSISATTTKSTSNHHRRHNSVVEYAMGSFSTPAGRDITATTPPKRAALVRFRSHRMFMFSCVGGAA